MTLFAPKERSRGPSFICVGPEKTGTSWLYANLRQHPDVFLTPIKEIRYFYEVYAYPGERWWARLSPTGDWHSRDLRSYLLERRRVYLKRPLSVVRRRKRLFWDARFVFGRRTDRWYLSLFADSGGRIAGDVSPQYFCLPDPFIAGMKSLLPDARIIVLLRDPVDWSWSFARMSLIGTRDPEDVPESEYQAFFHRYQQYYPTEQAIDRWMRHFPSNQVFFGFYDRLCEAPEQFFDEICTFLGVDASRTPRQVRSHLHDRKNPGRGLAMPAHVERQLSRQWIPEIERLMERFHPYPMHWRERCERVLSRR